MQTHLYCMLKEICLDILETVDLENNRSSVLVQPLPPPNNASQSIFRSEKLMSKVFLREKV